MGTSLEVGTSFEVGHLKFEMGIWSCSEFN